MSTRSVDKCGGDDCICRSLRRLPLRQPIIQIINNVSTIGGAVAGFPPPAAGSAIVKAMRAAAQRDQDGTRARLLGGYP